MNRIYVSKGGISSCAYFCIIFFWRFKLLCDCCWYCSFVFAFLSLFLSLARSLFSSLNSNECDDSVNAEKRLFFSFIWNLYRFKYHENTQIFLLLVSLDDGNNGNERRVRNKKMYIFTAVSSYLFTLRLWNSSLCLAFHFSYSVCVLWCVYMYRCI